ncbi:unnamed protein product [Trichogramma brassicae]|uniref:Uncharacterized protein n=1 Tax=Trichogramma brassicae TaxID=86971 RepID=A0A6H5HY99_9HYME|nr:unnamed protein product [Trichogramma brassicae]
MFKSADESGASLHGEGDKHLADRINQIKIESLKRLRKKVDFDVTEERVNLLRLMDPLISDWKGQYPNLRDIFRPKEIDQLLSDTVNYRDRDENKFEFFCFVANSGYVDAAPEPVVLPRTTAVHHAARRRLRWVRTQTVPDLLPLRGPRLSRRVEIESDARPAGLRRGRRGTGLRAATSRRPGHHAVIHLDGIVRVHDEIRRELVERRGIREQVKGDNGEFGSVASRLGSSE